MILYLLQIRSSASSQARISQDDPGILQQPLATSNRNICGINIMRTRNTTVSDKSALTEEVEDKLLKCQTEKDRNKTSTSTQQV